MYWANFLHLYQPADQQPDILEAVVKQSYEKLIQGIVDNPHIKITLNINGSLLELFDKYGYHSLIDNLRLAAKNGSLEFTGSAKYHAFLPLVSDNEIHRQIEINNETASYFLGDAYAPKGFFPPEMGYDPKLIPILEDFGFNWVILDEIAHSGGSEPVDYSKTYKIKDSNLNVYFRDRRISNLIMSAVVRTPGSLKEALKGDLEQNRYAVTGMDGETFGHHRPDLENLLFKIFNDTSFKFIKISEIPQYFSEVIDVEPVASTWASSKEDIEKGIQFLSWYDPSNDIHKWQWELLNIVLNEVYQVGKSSNIYDTVRHSMDKAVASDHFWWASAKPWWSVEMIEDGAHQLLETIKLVPNADSEKVGQAYNLYQNIVSTAFNWQRTGKIRQMAKSQSEMLRIPFKDRTIGAGGAEEGVYYAFMEMMKKLEKKAAETGEYEKAVLWRDAIYKLENKLDIYDMINAIDLLRIEIPFEEVERTIEKYKEAYHKMRGGQPEQRGA
ncbi:MAG: hypothetical protein UU77_C0019G0013 [candidate division WWE3 bacterium GW2011_GWC1_41_7]|uniref:Glycoside hydrolase family 57 N-terminal domain-containing protein n=3 Tax=Katanobacteria TaxID=422282 RepID=A0A0G0X6Y8_UNCKA|nr:MAG: hypothetical protein UU77_C0019G0013 [candidate division WWE3 bacterium GW2011_GWC1_41_7]